MRGEFIGVWPDMWREIWLPLIERPLDENEEGVPADIFCELYRELAKVLKMPTDDDAIALLLEDAVTLRKAFELSAQRANPELTLELVDASFRQSGATELTHADARRTAIEAALKTLLGQPATPLLDVQLHELAQDPSEIEAARRRGLERIINDRQKSREAFENTRAEDIAGERMLVGFLESVHDTLEELGGDELTNLYFTRLTAFIEKFSLRYDLRRPCMLCPTLPGVFASLVRDLRALTCIDPHLDGIMKDFENALRDLRIGSSDDRVRHCIEREVILLEALGQNYPGVTQETLGAICGQIPTWPHEKLLEAMKCVYKFTNNYPGIRHAGNPASALRTLDMRDLIPVSILLAG
ncbi:MAG: hypothetical protein PHG93_06720, partial [Candidatus Methanomethylophilaceae archaeon]|nr:hypothetical protein [Candidatus Methanomethylophilaceae archaeon]